MIYYLIVDLKITNQYGHITSPKHQRLQHWPNIIVAPMLGNHICRINLTFNVEETQNLVSDGLKNAMK